MKLRFSAREITSESIEYPDAESLGFSISQSILRGDGTSDNPYELELEIENGRDFCGVFHIEAVTDTEDKPQFFMPGYMYGDNTAELPGSGRKKFPRIRLNGQRCPESDYWMTRSDRLAAPVSMIFTGSRVCAVSAAPYTDMSMQSTDKAVGAGMDMQRTDKATGAGMDMQSTDKADGTGMVMYAGFTCRLGENEASVGYTLGYENAPWLFVQTATVYERAQMSSDNCVSFKAGEVYKVRLFIYDYDAKRATDIYKCLRKVYTHFHEPVRILDGMSHRKAAEMLALAIADYAWLADEKMYTGFVYDRPEGFAYNKIGSLTWTNGLSVAVPMLLAGERLHNEKMREQAITCIDYFADTCLNESSGLPFDAIEDGKWSIRGWWYDGMHTPGHSGYLTGQAMYYFLKAYEHELIDCNVKHDKWLALAGQVIERVNSVMNTDYEYPFAMSQKSGAGLEYDSFGSCWCLAATAYYMYLTGDLSFLERATKSENHYFDEYVAKCVCYGGPLDTDKAVDNEGILAYARAVRYLHMISLKQTEKPLVKPEAAESKCTAPVEAAQAAESEKLLEHLRYALEYECSFKLCYNTRITLPPLSKTGWSSCGGSITSVANPHIHPMSSTITGEMLYYVKATGDEYIKARLEDTCNWGMQTFNTFDGEYDFGRIGWMSERFCFCQGLVVEKYPDGSPATTWFALMPWASASIIEGFVSEREIFDRVF